jgi:hypothetical protein
MSKSYEYLGEFCKVRNSTISHWLNINPYTNRAKWILEKLRGIGVSHREVLFNPSTLNDVTNKSRTQKLLNIEVKFETNPELPYLFFIAHHDIVNNSSDNMNDNSASVCHLLELCQFFKDQKFDDKNIVIYFTDREEYGAIGAKKLSRDINFGLYGPLCKVVNLELTGFGTEIHMETMYHSFHSDLSDKITEKYPFVHKLNVPMNDSVKLRTEGIDSVCLGLLPITAIYERKSHRFPRLWALCHSTDDKFENASMEDMSKFNDFLKQFASEYDF